jgi:hypothetical protein
MQLVMDGGRQPRASEHLPAPTVLRVFMRRFDDAVGGLLFPPFEDRGVGFGGPGIEKQREVIGHHRPPEELELHILSPLFPPGRRRFLISPATPAV